MSIEVWKDVAKDVYPFATWLHCISPRILKRQNSFFLKQLEAKKKEEATPAKANSQPFLHSFLILILHPSFIVAVFLNLCYSWKQQVLWLYIAMYILHQKGLDVIAKTLEYSTVLFGSCLNIHKISIDDTCMHVTHIFMLQMHIWGNYLEVLYTSWNK